MNLGPKAKRMLIDDSTKLKIASFCSNEFGPLALLLRSHHSWERFCCFAHLTCWSAVFGYGWRTKGTSALSLKYFINIRVVYFWESRYVCCELSDGCDSMKKVVAELQSGFKIPLEGTLERPLAAWTGCYYQTVWMSVRLWMCATQKKISYGKSRPTLLQNRHKSSQYSML